MHTCVYIYTHKSIHTYTYIYIYIPVAVGVGGVRRPCRLRRGAAIRLCKVVVGSRVVAGIEAGVWVGAGQAGLEVAELRVRDGEGELLEREANPVRVEHRGPGAVEVLVDVEGDRVA